MKSPKSAAAPSPKAHSENIRRELSQLIDCLEAGTGRSDDPRYGALVDKATEVLKSLRLLFERFGQGSPAKREGGKAGGVEPKNQAATSGSSSSSKGSPPSAKPTPVSAKPSPAPTKPAPASGKTAAPAKVEASKEKEKAAGKTAEKSPPPPSAKGAANKSQAPSSKPAAAKTAEPTRAAPSRTAVPDKAADKADSSAGPSTAPAKVADPAELEAKARLQRKEARAPRMPGGPVAPKAIPPQSGKPIWSKPHSS